MSNKYDIVIIGGGLGGLLSGNILSKEGLSVCVVEKNSRLGGSIQSFSKNKTIFNTGLNYTESLGKGEILNQYFKYFGIMSKLKFRQLDKDGFNRISFGAEKTEYYFAQGHDNFVNTLSNYFPNSKNNLKKYIKTLKKISNSFSWYTLDAAKKVDNELLYSSTYNYLKTVDTDHKLQQVLAGMNILYGGVAEKTPLYIHALINYSFIQSSWRLVDGGSQLAVKIAETIRRNGGKILMSSKVISISGENKKVQYVELENGEKIFADKIISNIHPANTLKLVSENLSKKIYKQRILSLKNTIGMFTVYIVLKRNKFPYMNYNHHHFYRENVWTSDYKQNTWPEHYFLYTPAISKSTEWADGLIAMTYMSYDEVKKWENTNTGNRGEEYEEFKRQKAEKLIDVIQEKIPDIRKVIHTYYTSTPLTYRDYTGTPEGTSYGILKDYKYPYHTIITPKSRIKNLYFTGQNLYLHGILGVSISAVITCSEILGKDYLMKKIRNV